MNKIILENKESLEKRRIKDGLAANIYTLIHSLDNSILSLIPFHPTFHFLLSIHPFIYSCPSILSFIPFHSSFHLFLSTLLLTYSFPFILSLIPFHPSFHLFFHSFLRPVYSIFQLILIIFFFLILLFILLNTNYFIL